STTSTRSRLATARVAWRRSERGVRSSPASMPHARGVTQSRRARESRATSMRMTSMSVLRVRRHLHVVVLLLAAVIFAAAVSAAGKAELADAAQRGDIDAVRALLAKKV